MSYAYISGVIKYKERELLNPTDIERMADAKDAETAFRVFNDTDYADNLLNVDAENFQEALDDDLRQVKELFEKHLDKELIKFLFIRHDGHNIKLLFKSKYIGKNLDGYLSKSGIEDPRKIKEYIGSKNAAGSRDPALPAGRLDPTLPAGRSGPLTRQLDHNIKHVIDKTKEFIGNRPFPHRIDYIVDREIFHILRHISKNLKNKFLLNLTGLQIDLANLKVLLRSKITGKPYEFVEKKFIKYGNIDITELNNLYKKNLKDSIGFFMKHFNDKELARVFKSFLEENNSFWKIEKAIENLEMGYIRKTKFIAYGPEIPVGYYYAKRGAMRNIRTIMTGKLNNIGSEEIKDRLRELY